MQCSLLSWNYGPPVVLSLFIEFETLTFIFAGKEDAFTATSLACLDHIYQQNSTRVDLSNLLRIYLYNLLQSLLPCRMLLATPSLITTILMLLLTRGNGGVVGALPMDVAGVYGTGIPFGGAEHVPYPNPPTRGWVRSRIAIFQPDEPVNVYVDYLENGLPTERSRLIVGDYKQPQKHFEYRAHRPSPDSVSLVVDLYNPRKPNIPLLALPHVPDSSQPGEFTHMGQIFLTPNQNSQYLYMKGGGDLLTRIGTREDDTTMVPVLVELSNRGYIQAALRLLFSPAFQDYDSEDLQGQRDWQHKGMTERQSMVKQKSMMKEDSTEKPELILEKSTAKPELMTKQESTSMPELILEKQEFIREKQESTSRQEPILKKPDPTWKKQEFMARREPIGSSRSPHRRRSPSWKKQEHIREQQEYMAK
ncbi:hypothetical protein C8R42DRAFT_638809 [Lentinula raphanica]|nr:hypothetical protein C8R42DRAFT_638809 [Lentinula raphanica]